MIEFEWDPDKKEKVLADHNVDFDKIKDVFNDPFALEFIDEAHSGDDDIRFGIVGLTAEYGMVYLVFTEVDPNKVRFVTARRAEKWMVSDYEKERRRI